MALTDKQRRFVDEYVKCWNATEAARRAGYNATNGSLANIGWENVRKREIKEQIDRYLDESAMSAKEVLMRLAKQARADIANFADVRQPKDLEGHPDSGVVKKMTPKVLTGNDGKKIPFYELELYDAQSALQLIGKHHGLFTEKHEHSGPGGAPITTKKAVPDLDDLSDDELEQLIQNFIIANR